MITTQTAVSVGAAVMDAAAVQIARDFLHGYSGDYYFFQYSQADLLHSTEYILITGTQFETDEETGALLTGDSFTVFDITALTELITVPRTDAITGRLIGLDDGVAVEEFKGSLQHSDTEKQTQWLTQVYTVDHQVAILNDGVDGAQFLTYGSDASLPHLIQGSENYAFYISCLLSVSFVFGCFARVFKHISN